MLFALSVLHVAVLYNINNTSSFRSLSYDQHQFSHCHVGCGINIILLYSYFTILLALRQGLIYTSPFFSILLARRDRIIEQNRIEQNRIEQNRIEQNNLFSSQPRINIITRIFTRLILAATGGILNIAMLFSAQFPESSLQLPDLSNSVGVLDINDTKVVHTRLCFRFDGMS